MRKQDGTLPPLHTGTVASDNRDVLLLKISNARTHGERNEVPDKRNDVVLGDLLLDFGFTGRRIASVIFQVEMHRMTVEPPVGVGVGLPYLHGLLATRENGANQAAVGTHISNIDCRSTGRVRGAAATRGSPGCGPARATRSRRVGSATCRA